MGYATYGKKVQHPGTQPHPFLFPAWKFACDKLELDKEEPDMTHKDPTQQLLAAYTNLLQGQITYGGQAVTIGTQDPPGRKAYTFIFL